MSIVSAVNDLATSIGADIKSLYTNKAPLIGTPTTVVGDTTISLNMSGTTLVWNGTTNITLTFPASLPAGFKCRVCQASTGSVSFVFQGRLQFGNAFRSTTLFPWDVVDVELIVTSGNGVGVLIFNDPLPSLWAQGSSDLTVTTSTMVNLPGTALVLEPFGAYDIDLRLMYSTPVASAAALKIGFANLTTGSTMQVEYKVATTNVSGTAPWRTGFLYGSTSLVSGAANSTVANIKLHAIVSGRIITGTDYLTLTPQVGLSTASTTNTAVIAGSDVSIGCKKVYGT